MKIISAAFFAAFVLIFSSLSVAAPSRATPSATPLRILFIGNSLTGFNNLPGLFRELANRSGQTPYVETSLRFGQPLSAHLADQALRKELQTQNFDFIVLQEYSDLPLRDPAAFEKDVTEFTKLIARPGAAVPSTHLVLFENWPYAPAPDNTVDQLDKEYSNVATANSASIVYLAHAMTAARHLTHASLYAPNDEKHPSPLATYMNALMFLKFFYHVDPHAVAHVGCQTNTADVYLGPATAPALVDLDPLYGQDVTLVQDVVAKTAN